MDDHRSSFGGPFANLARAGGLEVLRTGIESHSSIKICALYHQPLRSTLRKMMIYHPGANKHLTLAPTLKVMNDKLGPSGVVRSTLVPGERPPVFTCSETPGTRPSIDERAQIAFDARQEIGKQMAKIRTDRFLRHATPPSAEKHANVVMKYLFAERDMLVIALVDWLALILSKIGIHRKRLFMYGM